MTLPPIEQIYPTPAAAPAASSAAADGVAELQGLYGPFSFPEKLLQKIWLRGDFDRRRAVTVDGRRVKILHPGRWNLLGGPDFRDARIRIGDTPEITGDVELHLHAGDWAAHKHAADPAYDRVVLHVVLFPPAPDHVTRGAGDREIPVLPLLPLVHHDLEEFADDDAIEAIAQRPAARILEKLGQLPPAELAALIAKHAENRLWQKTHFARLRLHRLGWDEACHQTALEILGYRFNRAPMLRVATAYPLTAWTAGLDPATAYASEETNWALQGVRPANHPRSRLVQYARWVAERPDWPARLATLGSHLPTVDALAATGDMRREHKFTDLRRGWLAEICADTVGGTRFDNLVCDGFLPLLAARSDRPVDGIWQHWFAGDLPAILPQALRQLGIFADRAHPVCHGAVQGLLGWLLEQEKVVSGSGRGA